MLLAQRQLDSLLLHVEQSAQNMTSLIGVPCSSQTIQQLRQQLAITPNVGNIELAASGQVYCSSLQGVVLPGIENRESLKLYLSSDIKALQGHPFVLFHLQHGPWGLYTSTDGYYIRNILEAASALAPVSMITDHGWMAQDGKIHYDPAPHQGNFFIQSKQYGFSLIADVDPDAVISTGLKRGRLMIIILICFSVAAGIAAYIWSKRPGTSEMLLMDAMKNKELHPYLQPILKGEPPIAIGCEVLVRWLHKDNLIPPDQFIPLAEQTGLIIPITQQLIAQVTDNFASNFKTSKPFYISFNVSAKHLESEKFQEDFDYFLSRVGHNLILILEITEREILSDNTQVAQNIAALKAKGVRFALDDFGTGYATLEILKRTPVDIIKIDKLFTSGIGKNDICNEIIGNIIDLAGRLHADVTAEGVETKEQVDFLKTQGEIAYQGYLFSKPLSLGEFKQYLARVN